MSVTIKNNTPSVQFEIENGIGLAIRMLLEDIYVEANPNTPQKLGDLRARVIRKMDSNTKGSITWDSKYAAVQEKGYRMQGNRKIEFKHYTTPGTGPHYAQNAVEQTMKKLPNYLKKVGLI